MNAMTSVFPFTLRWDSHDLADAVPLRLFEMVDFAAGDDAGACANAGALRGNTHSQHSYLPAIAITPLFRIGG